MAAKDIFLQAIDIADAAEREAFVSGQCGPDLELKRKVVALLAANSAPESFLDLPAAQFEVTATAFGNRLEDRGSDSSHHGRFLPGTKLADRYRIVSLLGRGGMGEVYRADDLRLGQTVALKFLPRELAKDAKRLEYFHQEVKLARQISHPNICRVYDIGEVNGQQYLSMEYIDGEDLKTLLHRIGRLPKDKGVQIARQLCSGLAAAHAKGVLHRDLKPANVMLDGQGQVRITDFGLATVSADGENVIGMSGTPAYMAPEQLLRGQTSPRSDIYSLGLILFEVFTGKPAHNASSLPELQRLHTDSSSVRNPSDIVEDLDPVIERAITRCLAADPSLRPRTVSELAAALPGGDPLAAALAAGETPHPEIVAMSGESTLLPLKQAVLLLMAFIIGLLATIFIREHSQWVNSVEPMLSPEVLTYRSREILEHLGINQETACGDYALGYDHHLIQLENQQIARKAGYENWPKMLFWYRQTPGRFEADSIGHATGREGIGMVDLWYPAWSLPQMAGVRLDCAGKLRWFQATPATVGTESETRLASGHNALLPWKTWFPQEFTGFDLDALQPQNSAVIPSVLFDQVQAWSGNWPGTDDPVQVVTAAFRNQPVYFEILNAEGQRLEEPSVIPTGIQSGITVYVVIQWLFFVIACGLVIRNIVWGRWDRRGALRVSVAVALLSYVSLLTSVHHSSTVWEFEVLYLCELVAVGVGFYAWTNYVALEPIVRRHWPRLLISWSRLLGGRWMDPMIGSDLLLGACAGVMVAFTFSLYPLIDSGFQETVNPRRLVGVTTTIGGVLRLLGTTIASFLFNSFLVVVIRWLCRSSWVALAITVLLFGTIHSLSDSLPLTLWPFHYLLTGVMVAVLARFGLLAVITAGVAHWSLIVPITADPSRFYFANGLVSICFVLAIAAFGFVSALGGWHKLTNHRRVAW